MLKKKGCFNKALKMNHEHRQSTPNVAKARIYMASQAAQTSDSMEASTVMMKLTLGKRGHTVTHQMRSSELQVHPRMMKAQV